MDNSFLHRKKLLLVDDEPDLLKMVSDILSDAGFETVLTAATVKDSKVSKEYRCCYEIFKIYLSR